MELDSNSSNQEQLTMVNKSMIKNKTLEFIPGQMATATLDRGLTISGMALVNLRIRTALPKLFNMKMVF